jgi:hypothetical protein
MPALPAKISPGETAAFIEPPEYSGSGTVFLSYSVRYFDKPV